MKKRYRDRESIEERQEAERRTGSSERDWSTSGSQREAGEQIKYDGGAVPWGLSGKESACQLQEPGV